MCMAQSRTRKKKGVKKLNGAQKAQVRRLQPIQPRVNPEGVFKEMGFNLARRYGWDYEFVPGDFFTEGEFVGAGMLDREGIEILYSFTATDLFKFSFSVENLDVAARPDLLEKYFGHRQVMGGGVFHSPSYPSITELHLALDEFMEDTNKLFVELYDSGV